MRTTTSRMRGVGLGITAGLALAVAGNADENEDTIQFGDMVVTATRSAVASTQIPSNMTVITAEDIAKGNYTDVVGVLERRAGLHFRSFSGNQEANVDIRGFGENSHSRVLILRDGRKLNRPDQRGINWSQIPLASIERIEIMRGPNGAVYGDYAVGGVINIITKKGTEKPTGELLVEVGSENSNRQVATTTGRLGSVDYAVSLERSETAGWRDRTGTRTEGGDLSLGHDFTEGLRLDVNMNVLETDYELPGGQTEAAYKADPTDAANASDEAEETYYSINPTLTAQLGGYGEFILDLGYAHKDVETDMVSWWAWSDLEMESLSAAPRVVITVPVADFGNRLTLGVDWTRDTIDLNRYNDAARTVYAGGADVTRNTLGMYVNDAVNLTDTIVLSGGARWGRATFDAEEEDGTGTTIGDDDKTHREEAYNVGLTWNAAENTRVFVKYEHFFRFPCTDEQISYNGWGAGAAFNQNLAPETGDSYEVGIEQNLPGNVTVAATLFYMEMEDEIATDFLSPSFNSNMDDTTHQGLELSVTADPWSSLSLYGNYTWLKAEFDDGANDGNDIPLVPEHKVVLGAEVRPMDGLRINVDGSYTSRMYAGGDTANALDRMDSYVVVDLGIAYAAEIQDITWEIFAGVDNLFDEEYTNFVYWGGYYAAPGRTYKGGVKVGF